MYRQVRRQGVCFIGGAKCLATAARAGNFCASPEEVAQRGGLRHIFFLPTSKNVHKKFRLGYGYYHDRLLSWQARGGGGEEKKEEEEKKKRKKKKKKEKNIGGATAPLAPPLHVGLYMYVHDRIYIICIPRFSTHRAPMLTSRLLTYKESLYLIMKYYCKNLNTD